MNLEETRYSKFTYEDGLYDMLKWIVGESHNLDWPFDEGIRTEEEIG